jgi:hypothetical protein
MQEYVKSQYVQDILNILNYIYNNDYFFLLKPKIFAKHSLTNAIKDPYIITIRV